MDATRLRFSQRRWEARPDAPSRSAAPPALPDREPGVPRARTDPAPSARTGRRCLATRCGRVSPSWTPPPVSAPSMPVPGLRLWETPPAFAARRWAIRACPAEAGGPCGRCDARPAPLAPRVFNAGALGPRPAGGPQHPAAGGPQGPAALLALAHHPGSIEVRPPIEEGSSRRRAHAAHRARAAHVTTRTRGARTLVRPRHALLPAPDAQRYWVTHPHAFIVQIA